jgi:signal transduction histidine kinase
VSRELIRGLGGTITVTSTVGRGTVFRVTLPMAS